ncbi:MAG: hypothetical protein ABI577_00075 [bacterium]
MPASRTQLAKWATNESQNDDPASALTTQGYDFAAQVLRNPRSVAHLKGERLSRLVGRLGFALSYIRDDSGPRRVHFAAAMAKAAPPAFEIWFGSLAVDSDGLYMFWDHARNFRDDRPRLLHDAMFDALRMQLQSSNVWIQQSALHGFGHLHDPECVPVIATFLEVCDQPWLAEYARKAARFEVL